MITTVDNNYKTLPYRPCAGMMVLDKDGYVLVGKRFDSVVEAWQMPQGGIDKGEDNRTAALRELREEVGTDDVTIIAETRDWLTYDLPDHLIPIIWNGKFRGQQQKWFLMRLNGARSVINIKTEHPEFSAIDWVKPACLPSLVVPFKKTLYEQVLTEFSEYLIV